MSVHALIAILLCILTILGEILSSFFLLLAGDLFLEAEASPFVLRKAKARAAAPTASPSLGSYSESKAIRKGRFIPIKTSVSLFQRCLVCRGRFRA